MDREEAYTEAIEFLKDTFRGWLSNMMKDFDAQGLEVPLHLIADALTDLANEIYSEEYGDVEDFLEELFPEED